MSTVAELLSELRRAYEEYKAATQRGERWEKWKNYFRVAAKFCSLKCKELPRGERVKCFRNCMRAVLHGGPEAATAV